jgi:2-dehydropantoate 2-reductase
MNAECAAIAAANGFPQTPEFRAEHDARMTRAGSGLTASMFRDVRKGAPVEVEHTLGDFLARGRARGVQAPLVQAAYVQLAVYERKRAAKQNA